MINQKPGIHDGSNSPFSSERVAQNCLVEVMSKLYSYAYAPDAKIVDEIWSTLEKHSLETHKEFGTLKFSRSEAMNQTLEKLGEKK